MSSSPLSFGSDRLVNAVLAWRKAILVGAGLFICGYAVSVLWYAQSFPDIGLRCMFSPVVHRVHDGYVRGADSHPPPDLDGFTIDQIGPYPIDSWPTLLRSLILLDTKDAAVPVADLTQAGERTFVRLGNEKLVQVQLHRAGEAPVTVWCLLGHPHLDTLMPSLVWLLLNLGLFAMAAMLFWKRRPTGRRRTSSG